MLGTNAFDAPRGRIAAVELVLHVFTPTRLLMRAIGGMHITAESWNRSLWQEVKVMKGEARILHYRHLI